MENPRSINRFLLGMLIAAAALAVAATIYFREIYFLIGFVAALALAFAVFGFVGVINVILFAPVFWLMAKLTGRKPKSAGPGDEAAGQGESFES